MIDEDLLFLITALINSGYHLKNTELNYIYWWKVNIKYFFLHPFPSLDYGLPSFRELSKVELPKGYSEDLEDIRHSTIIVYRAPENRRVPEATAVATTDIYR